MYVLFIVLNEVDHLDTILAKFVEIGIKGATILDSQGMGSAIVDRNIPLFGSLKNYFDGSRPFNKTIFTVIHNEEILEKAKAEVKKLAAEINKPSAGFMFAMPVISIDPLGC